MIFKEVEGNTLDTIPEIECVVIHNVRDFEQVVFTRDMAEFLLESKEIVTTAASNVYVQDAVRCNWTM